VTFYIILRDEVGSELNWQRCWWLQNPWQVLHILASPPYQTWKFEVRDDLEQLYDSSRSRLGYKKLTGWLNAFFFGIQPQSFDLRDDYDFSSGTVPQHD